MTQEAKNNKGVRGAQSIQRAVSVLYAVARKPETGLRLHEIADAVELNVSTVHRILAALLEADLLFFDKKSKSYFMGTGLVLMGAGTQSFAMKEKYHPVLEKVAQKFGDSCYLYLRSNNDYICMDRVEGSFAVQVFSANVSDSRPLGFGVGGVTMLAFLAENECEAILEANRDRLNAYSPTKYYEVRRCITVSQERGYGYGENLACENSIGVGVPITDNAGTICGAICVSSVTDRMQEDRQKEIVAYIQSALTEHTAR